LFRISTGFPFNSRQEPRNRIFYQILNCISPSCKDEPAKSVDFAVYLATY
jgi:hypothetical protein